MSQSRHKIVRRLMEAQQDRAPVTVRRKHLDIDSTSGIVIALTENWVVLHDLVESVYLDDIVLMRLDHVTKVEPHRDQSYVIRAVSGLDEPVGEFECASDSTVGDLLVIVAERAELVGVHLESPEGDWINFGKIRGIGKKRLDFQFIGRDGDWVDFIEAWKLKDVTRIEFGGRYVSALERFGDEMPETLSRKKR